MTVYIQVLGNGCTRYLLTQLWVNLKSFSRGTLTNNHLANAFASTGSLSESERAILSSFCSLVLDLQQFTPHRLIRGMISACHSIVWGTLHRDTKWRHDLYPYMFVMSNPERQKPTVRSLCDIPTISLYISYVRDMVQRNARRRYDRYAEVLCRVQSTETQDHGTISVYHNSVYLILITLQTSKQ